jgi:chemotaxis protein CheD
MVSTPQAASKVFLKPGELFITYEPTVISTVLGSCISVTMFNPRFKVGGMCHALLPTAQSASGHDAFRFVDRAIPYMIEEFARFGIKRKDIEVKLFGGSDVLSTIGGENAPATVGNQNVRRALEVIEKERLVLLAEDVRGEEGRKILFHTHTGNILLKRIRKTESYGALNEKDQSSYSR